jgi:hypothetical protein
VKGKVEATTITPILKIHFQNQYKKDNSQNNNNKSFSFKKSSQRPHKITTNKHTF